MADLMGDVEAAPVQRVGEKLRAARVEAGLDLSDIAQKTRVPLRHLEAIEESNYGSLPSFTYAAGFVRAYARAVGADEASLGNALRLELGRQTDSGLLIESDDVADPARVPPRWLAWTALFILILFAGGYGFWRSSIATPEPTPAPAAAPRPAAPKPSAPPAMAAGPVILTALDDVWFRVYDRQDKVLFEGIKKKGESYTVPTDADQPMIRTGRADQIAVSVGGKTLPPLGPAERTVKDVVLTATALTAKPADPAAMRPAEPVARPSVAGGITPQP